MGAREGERERGSAGREGGLLTLLETKIQIGWRPRWSRELPASRLGGLSGALVEHPHYIMGRVNIAENLVNMLLTR